MPKELMTAVVQDRYGEADVLYVDHIPRPTVADNEVLIRVEAASVDRGGAWHLMAGLPYPLRLAGFGLRRPRNRVRGLDVSGRVEAVGSSVTRVAVGRRCTGSRSVRSRSTHAHSRRRLPQNLPGCRSHRQQRCRSPPSQRCKPCATTAACRRANPSSYSAHPVASVSTRCRWQKPWRSRHRRVQHLENRYRPLHRCRRGSRLPRRRRHRRIASVRRHHRHRRQPPTARSSTGAHTHRNAGDRRRRERRTVARRNRSPNTRTVLVSVHISENGHLHRFGDADDLEVLTQMIDAGDITPVIDSVHPLADTAVAVARMVDGSGCGKQIIATR